jgi:hypothetical protein
MRNLLLVIPLLAGACATSQDGPASASQVRYGPIWDLDGNRVHLSTFAQDRVVLVTSGDGRTITRIAPLSYLLLIVTHSECEWSRKLAEELTPELPELDRLGVRTVCLLSEKEGHPTADWRSLERDDLAILEDRDGELYGFYVKDKTPSINIIDAWGNRRLFAEGFMEPATLLEKIRNEDFAPVPPGAG